MCQMVSHRDRRVVTVIVLKERRKGGKGAGCRLAQFLHHGAQIGITVDGLLGGWRKGEDRLLEQIGKIELMNYWLATNGLQKIDEGYIPIGSTENNRIHCIGTGPDGTKQFCAFTADGETKIEISDFRQVVP